MENEIETKTDAIEMLKSAARYCETGNNPWRSSERRDSRYEPDLNDTRANLLLTKLAKEIRSAK